VSLAFLVLAVIGALFTLNALRPPRHLDAVGVLSFPAGWVITELWLYTLVVQAVGTAIFVGAGALDDWQGWLAIALTGVSWLGILLGVVQSRRARSVLEQALHESLDDGYTDEAGEHLAGEPSLRWQQLLLPFRLRHPDVERLRELDYVGAGVRTQRLDIFRNRREPPSVAPVFLLMPGGGWTVSPRLAAPVLLSLAAHGWVCITASYAVGRSATFPEHLVDVKRTIRWVRSHIADYGGDPGHIVIGGASAGAHLCSLAALTPNDPVYQPGFEDADTTVQACVAFYGVYDVTNRDGIRGKGFVRWFARSVMKMPLADAPEAWAKACPVDQVGPWAPPFFVIHGTNDTLVPVEEARSFAQRLRAVSSEPVIYAELPGAQHAFDAVWSIREAHAVRAVERFAAWTVERRRSPGRRRLSAAEGVTRQIED
jgi:acetyl esterase/lipase